MRAPQVDPGAYGVRAATYEDLVEVLRDPRSASFRTGVDSLVSSERIDRRGFHIVMPFLENGFSAEIGERSFRCYLWFLEAGRNARTCVLADMLDSHLSRFRRVNSPGLERIVLNLLGEFSIETL